jgi:RNA polymerase sigma-70 factor (ECF subfamily)
VQETFFAALKSINTFAAKSSQKTWLFSILKHKILDHYRHTLNTLNSRIDSSDDIDLSFNEKGEWRLQLDEWSEQPDNSLIRKEFSQVLHHCLAHLPDAQRAVFELREIDGFSTEELCKELNLSATNMLVLLHRARKKLRDCLETNWFRESDQ